MLTFSVVLASSEMEDEAGQSFLWSVPLEDSVLASAASAGDSDAFALLVKRYDRYVYAIAYKMVLDEDDAFDVTQTVFLRVAERIGDFDGRGAFRSWIGAIAVREALSLLRRRERSGRHETPTDPERLERLADESVSRNGVGSPLRAVVEKEQRERVEAAMGCLSDQQRAVFVLRFREEMRPREIAERLGLPAGQVRVQLHRAVARLRELLEESP